MNISVTTSEFTTTVVDGLLEIKDPDGRLVIRLTDAKYVDLKWNLSMIGEMIDLEIDEEE